jgi:DNA polymerase-3 subunit delta
MDAAQLYSYPGVENALLLLHQYNLKSVGVGDMNTPDSSLLKEMVVRMLL